MHTSVHVRDRSSNTEDGGGGEGVGRNDLHLLYVLCPPPSD